MFMCNRRSKGPISECTHLMASTNKIFPPEISLVAVRVGDSFIAITMIISRIRNPLIDPTLKFPQYTY